MSDIVAIESNEPLTKPKKPKTAKQMEAFEKVKERRKQSIEANKQQKLLESAKLLIESESKKQSQPQPTKKQPKEKPLPEYTERDESEDESEEEIIVVKKSKPKPKPKKKVRTVIIESSDSSDSSESESEEEKEIKVEKKIQKNQPIQKAPVRIVRPNIDYKDFFC